MEMSGEKVAMVLAKLRKEKPLVHHITNQVVTNITANATLAAGALPVMAFAVDEVADMVATADALVLNMGTPTPATVEAMLVAGRVANSRGIPVIFDPVGVGATPYRNRIAEQILENVKVSVVRGNASEVAFLAGGSTKIKGVEAIEQDVPPVELSPLASRRLGTVVAITGQRDYISDGRRLAVVANGHAMMASITGSGCVSTAIIAAFCAVEPDAVVASASALAYLGVAGQLAAEVSHGPGSFQMNWFDKLATLSPRELAGLAVVSCTDIFRQALEIYVITDSRLSLGRSTTEVVRRAIAGGARLIQLREKGGTDRQLVAIGQALREITSEAGAFLLVNDRVDIAQAIGADGVHLGQDDLPVALARKILGPGKIIGVSVETGAEARAAEEAGADYVATGPIFATTTKPDAGAPYGTGLIGRIKAATSLPVVAIGGINAGNLADVVRAGADGAAMIGAIVGQTDIAGAVRELRQKFHDAKKQTNVPKAQGGEQL